MTGVAGDCARAASGDAATTTPRSAITARRLMVSMAPSSPPDEPSAETGPQRLPQAPRAAPTPCGGQEPVGCAVPPRAIACYRGGAKAARLIATRSVCRSPVSQQSRIGTAGLWSDALRAEWFLGFSFATTFVFAFGGETLYRELSNPLWLAPIFLWLFATVMGSALAVVRHADQVAEVLGEPYGTLVLTLSVTAIEVMSITAVMLHGENNPTLVRDTLFAIIMIVLGVMVGGSLLMGGWRHREQHYNLQGANAYLGVIIPLSVLILSLPDFTMTAAGQTLPITQEIFIDVMSVGLYSVFLAIQTGRHRGYFRFNEPSTEPHLHATPHAPPRLLAHAVLLMVYMAPVPFLAEQLAHPIDYLIETLAAP